MNVRSQIVAPQAVLTGEPEEDRRRDEVLCRLLNTPYRPIHPTRAGDSAAEPCTAPAGDSDAPTDI